MFSLAGLFLVITGALEDGLDAVIRKLRGAGRRARLLWEVSMLRNEGLYVTLRICTLCRLGCHCKYRQRVQKFDGGRLPQLCCYCRLILEWGKMEDRS